jgi:uncharacterized protein (DUF1778 family)
MVTIMGRICRRRRRTAADLSRTRSTRFGGITPYNDDVTAKTERLDLRLTKDQRQLVEQAAAIAGSTLAGYSVTRLVEAAARSIAEARRLTLPPQDWEQFVAALDAPDDEAWLALLANKPVWEP